MNRKAKQLRRATKTIYGRLKFRYKRGKSHLKTVQSFLRSKERRLGRPLLMREASNVSRAMAIKTLKSVPPLYVVVNGKAY